jgi:hypothetical protein
MQLYFTTGGALGPAMIYILVIPPHPTRHVSIGISPILIFTAQTLAAIYGPASTAFAERAWGWGAVTTTDISIAWGTRPPSEPVHNALGKPDISDNLS